MSAVGNRSQGVPVVAENNLKNPECQHDWRSRINYDDGIVIIIYCWNCDEPVSSFAELQQLNTEFENDIVGLTNTYLKVLRNG